MMSRLRWTPWLLAAVLAGNFTLSVLGIDWGLPYLWHTDEKIDPAVHMIHNRTLDPDYFINPHLHIYAMAAVVDLAYRLNPGHTVMLTGYRIAPLLDPSNPGRRIQFMAIRGSRILSALFALGTILTVFAIGRRHFGEATGLLGAAFLAVTMGLVNLAHFATPESLLFLMMFLTLFACDGIASEGRVRDYALTGLFAGLAFATKYTAWILAIPILVAHAYRRGWRVVPWRGIAGLVVCALVGFAAFAATNPYAFIRWHDFVYWGFWFNWYTGAPTGSLVDMSQFQRSYGPYFSLLGNIMGWPLFVASLVGVGVAAAALWRGPRSGARARGYVLQLAWVLPFYVFYGASPHHALRFIMPIVPSLALLAAVAIVALHDGAATPSARRAVVATATAILVYSTVYTVRSDWMYWHDTRYEAGRWLESHHFTMNERLYYFEVEAYLPYFSHPFPLKYFPWMDDTGSYPREKFTEAAEGFYATATDPIVDSDFYWDRYTDRPWVYPERTAFYRQLLAGKDRAGYEPVARFTLHNPWWLDPRPERIAPEIVVFGKPALLEALGGRIVERVVR
jgi:hypothetical protein